MATCGARHLGASCAGAPASGEYVKYTTEHGLANNYVQAIAQGADGSLWFDTSGGSEPAGRGESWTTYTTADGPQQSDSVWSIAQGGTAACGSAQGGVVEAVDPARALDDLHHGPTAWRDDYVRAIKQAADGSLWFGTWGGGVRSRWTRRALDDLH